MALIALPCKQQAHLPPLPLAYIATLLEQRRHIVRIYDRALDPLARWEDALHPLRSFRPQLVIVAGDQIDLIEQAVDALRHDQHSHILPIQMSRGGLDVIEAYADALDWIEGRSPTTRTASPLTLDDLPHPARHLLSLEGYDLRAPGGELQTTLLIGHRQQGQIVLRAPTQIVAELRAVAEEFGLRHFLFPEVPITLDQVWLADLIGRLATSGSGASWEALVDLDRLNVEQIGLLAEAGCESISFDLEAALVFESVANRAQTRRLIATARANGIFTRATVKLEPPYESVPQLVDVAATFGLDDVVFEVGQAVSVGADERHLQAIARQIYDAGRSRQRFINRFGPTIGNLLWRLRGQRTPADDEELAV